MTSIKRLNHDELLALSNIEKERLIVRLFDLVDNLESQLKSALEKTTLEDHHERRKFQRTAIPSATASFCEIMLAEPKENSPPDYKHHYILAIDKARRNSSRYWHDSNEITDVTQNFRRGVLRTPAIHKRYH